MYYVEIHGPRLTDSPVGPMDPARAGDAEPGGAGALLPGLRYMKVEFPRLSRGKGAFTRSRKPYRYPRHPWL
ncbi:hypothetical protein DL990_14060 [Amycolatopsis sp. WAC 01416]|nr:hypothetical protein DL990_14060 [Amycolatopsis sp. WAC 01416]